MRQRRSSGSRGESFRNAFAGLAHVLRTQRNAWIHLTVTVGVLSLGILLGLSSLEWALLIGVIGLVWVAELTNTAIEAAVDLSSPEVHPLAQQAKDVSAAAVLLASATAALVGVAVFLPRLAELFTR